MTVTFTDTSPGGPTGWAWYFGDENFTAPWTQVNASAGWSARGYHSSVVMPDGSIVLMGGWASNGDKNDVWRSTDNGTTWTQQTAEAGWTPRYSPSSVAMPDGSIVLMGGYDNILGDKNDVWRSTDNGTTWTNQTTTSGSPGWSPRHEHSSVVMPDGSIVLMGGYYGDQDIYKNDVWRSTDNGATWTNQTTTSGSPGWSPRSAHSSVVMPDGSIVLMGGYARGNKNDVWRSTDNGATWTNQTTTSGSPGWSARSAHSSVVMPDGSIVLMGGWVSSYVKDVWRSTGNGITWTQVNASAGWSRREYFSSVAMPDGSIVLMGGWDGVNKNDTWRFVPTGSSVQNPSHTYTVPGIYSVTLQAYNSLGYNSTRKTGYITVTGPAPVANFTANVTAGTAPLTIQFTDNSTGTPTSWNWSFGDGNFSSVQNPVHTYTNPGNFTVALNSTSPSGTDTIIKSGFISVISGFTTPLPTPPENPVKLIFIHHSTGQNWLADDNGGLGIRLRDNNYFVSDTNYGWGPGSIGSTTDIGNWWQWFRSPQSPEILADLFNESGQHSTYSRLSTDPGGQNKIVMLKSCFPNSNLRGNPTDPVPPIEDNLLKANDSGSEHHTVANAKGIYIDLLEYFRTRPDTLFVVIAAPPLSAPDNSANARAFNLWLVNDWLAGYNQTNVAVWDFYNVLTTNGGDPTINDLNETTGNHHRWWNNSIQHAADLTFNTSAYPTGPTDDHPTRAGNLKATGEYIPLLNYAYNRWAGNNNANFTANITRGIIPLTVQFTDNSTGMPTAWNWSFGDGNFSTEQHPAYTYTFSGTFTVSLKATYAGGSNVKVRTNYISVMGLKPIPDFTGTPTSGTAPLPVSFTDQSLNNPTGWAWFFGDENFTAPWTQVNASAGWSARYSHTSVALPDGSIVLMGGLDGSYKNDTWRSTDKGATWTQVNASAGWSARYSHTSVALPDGSIVLMGGLDGSYKNDVWRSTDNGVTWSQVNTSAGWSARYHHSSVVMPDGSIVLMGGGIRAANSSYYYKNDTWRSTDNGATWTQQTASAGWSARYEHSSVAMPDGSIVLMGGGIFNSYKNDVWRSADNGVTWTPVNTSAGWSARQYHSSVAMPDGSIVLMGGFGGSYKNDTWRSTDNGVTWIQENASAGWSARGHQTSVALPDGSIVLMGGFDSSFSYNNDVWRVVPTGLSVQNPSHTYSTPGNYTVALQAYNSIAYNSTRKTGYITVTGSSAPVVNFTANVTAGTAPLTIQFTDNSTGTPTSWNWSFGDGNYSALQNPVHVYTFPGMFTVALNASNNGGSNTTIKTDYISAQQQPPPLAWQRSLGGSDYDQAQSIQQTTDGGYIVAGMSVSNDGDVTGNHGGWGDYWVVKLDSDRTIQWRRSLGGSGDDWDQSVQQTNDGGYIVAGFTSSTDGNVSGNHGGNDGWVVKLDSSGIIQWKKALGGSSHDFTYSVQQTADDGYIVAGATSSNNGDVTGNQGSYDYWVVKLDSAGTIQWQKCLGGSQQDTGFSSRQTADGGYIVIGSSISNDGNVTGNHGGLDYWVVKLDSAGTIQWQKSLGGSGSDHGSSIEQTTDGGYIVAGSSDSKDGDVTGNHGSDDYWVVRLDSTGTIQWQRSLGGSDVDDAASIRQTADGGYIVAGLTSSNDGYVTGNHGNCDGWVVKLDSAGIIQWQRSLGGSSNEGTSSIQQTSDDGLIIAGVSYSNDGDVTGNHGDNDFWIVKLGGSPAPLANFTGNVTSGTAPLTVQFNDTSTGSPTAWNWSFGDGNFAPAQNPVHNYPVPGIFSVSLDVSNPGGSNTTIRTGYVTVYPKGDLNANWRVDIGDVTRVAYMVVGLIQQDPRADFHNGNGTVLAGDAAKIAWYYVGKIPAL